MIVCNDCQTENDNDAVQCSECGADLPALNMPAGEQMASTLVVSSSPAGETTDEVSAIASSTRLLERESRFTPLPAGVMLAGASGEYEISQLRKDEADLHQYSGVAVDESHACTNCGFLHNPASTGQCQYCESDISSAEAAHLPVTILESAGSDAFGVLSRLAKLDFKSPHLRLPLDAFARRVGGQERHFLVLPPPPAATFKSRRPPEELPSVLHWGVALAGALSTLHEAQVAYGPITDSRLGLEANQASLCEFSRATYPGAAELFREDVASLAGFLYFLATNEAQYSATSDLPAPVAELFAQALTEGNGFDSAKKFQRKLDQTLTSLRRPASVDYLVGRKTDVGQIRQLNEDSLLALHMTWNNKSVNYPLGVFAVADGMGGHTAGEIASGLALQAVAQSALEYLISSESEEGLAQSHADWVRSAIVAANRAVHDQVEASQNDMGTTLVVSLLVGDQLFLGNVGDSRAYLINHQGIRQLTEDHSLVERLVASGQISRADARSHPQRNVIYRTIGDRGEVEVDSWRMQVKAGDRLLLCSDGLSGMVDDDRIYRLVNAARTPQVACEALVQAANVAGGTDNITALIVQVEASN